MNRIISSIFIIILTLVAAQNVFDQHSFNPRPIFLNQTADKWREDLRFFAEELPKLHKNAFHIMTRKQFEKAVKQLDTDIPNLTNDQIFVRFLELIAMVGDGHTSIEEVSLNGLGIYPLRYEILQDGLFVQLTAAEYSEIVGGKVVSIGNLSVEDALKKLYTLTWGDNFNEQARKVGISILLSSPKVLKGLKIAETDEKVAVTVEVEGQQKTVEINAVKDVPSFFRNVKNINISDKSSVPKPLYLKNPNNTFWFEYLKESKILYVQLNAVVNKPDESVADFFKKVFDFAENNPVDKFVLDVRMNTGGNNQLNKPIVIGLIKAKFNERGKLFVVIGRRTFSAAQLLINEIEKYANAIFVGEPTGSSPNFYSDTVMMTLPNSKIPFRVSRLWHQINPNDRRIFTVPEIFTPVSSTDFRNNVDLAFQAILNFVPGSTFKDLTAEAVQNSDISVFIKKYRDFKANPKSQIIDTEADTNALGYRLLQMQRFKDAIEVFKLNVEAYPNSANVYDSLGDGYSNAGNREDAIKNYEKALQINPSYQSSIDALRRLKRQ